jgi:hypothetical protein
MLCGHLPLPADASFEAVRTFAYDAVQRYEVCASRHNACAAKLGAADEE